MLEAIELAQHFIYIENQFFITSASPAPDFSDGIFPDTMTVTSSAEITEIKNKIGHALVQKIISAHK